MRQSYRVVVGSLTIVVLYACNASDHDRLATQESLQDTSTDPLAFYATQSPTTDPGRHAARLDDIPGDVDSIIETVQGLLVRVEAAERQGSGISRRHRNRDINAPTVEEIINSIIERDDRSLTEPRSQGDRFVAICAHYTMLTTSLLRHHGLPARARGGFETYVSTTKHHDHWITEYWDAAAERWVRLDAEIIGVETTPSGGSFSALDIPTHAFAAGAEAWKRCREEGASPEQFGISGDEWYGGWGFVLNELLLDFNALNRVESLPWDDTVISRSGYENLASEDLLLLDQVAEAVLAVDRDFERVRDLFRSYPALRKDG